MSKRNVICALTIFIGLLVALMGLSLPSSAEAASRTLFVASYAGQYEDTLKKSAPKFEAANDCRIVFVPISAMDAVIKIRAGEQLDIVHLDPIWSFRGEAEGLFAELDPALIPNLEHLYPVARLSGYTVAPNIGAYGIAYNPKFVNPSPDSWNIFLDPKYAGRVAMRPFMADSIEFLVAMAKMNGGDEENIDPGFARMEEIGKNIHTWWRKHPECLELFQREEIYISLWTDGRAGWAKTQGANVEFILPKEGSFPLVSTVNVSARSKNKELAMKYVNFLLEIDSGMEMAESMGYFPTNRNVKLPPEIQANMAYTSENADDIRMADWRKIIGKMDDWNERWEREIIQ